ncbi:Eco57I restriction-modification methylase domain-containing protein, partial [Chromatium okenii]|uniref:Eco57I restriction-modification methylase domain-containing protein n=1 Tax=Chromatium okenii TaxID=61644 RepID=UPI0026EB4D54
SGETWSRTQFASITRELNCRFPMPAIVLFRHGQFLSLAVIDRRDSNREVIHSRITVIKDVCCSTPHRAHLDILSELTFSNLIGERKQRPANFRDLYDAWIAVLSIQKLNQRFYTELSYWYFWTLKQVQFPSGGGANVEQRNAVAVIRLLTRLIFVWFIKEKKLVPAELFDPAALKTLLKTDPAAAGDAGNYYCAILQNLFFATLTVKRGALRKWATTGSGMNGYRYKNLFCDAPAALDLFARIPFLNSGLFECLDMESTTHDLENNFALQAIFPNRVFFNGAGDADLNADLGTKNKRYNVNGLFDIFARYQFTVEENMPLEEEVALDPEMLGKVFENLLASYNAETQTTARKQSGSFYTPREVVDYMVDEALLLYFAQAVTVDDQAAFKQQLRELLAYTSDGNPFAPEITAALIAAIEALRILDPACGSGAFPMGVLNKLVQVLRKLDPNNAQWRADYTRKRYLINHCIYGIDLQPIAVQITKLRFFMALLVNQQVDLTADNFGITALPNLETKLIATDSLMPIAALQIKLRDKLAQLLQSDQFAAAETVTQWMFQINSGFDIVIGNPPYVRQEAIKHLKDAFKKNYACFTGTADLYVYFFERAVTLLKPNGVLSFITSNKWYRAKYGTKLRQWLNLHTRLQQLLDFGDEAVFTAIAYPTILIATRRPLPVKKPAADEQIRVLNWAQQAPIETFPAVFAAESFEVAQAELKDEGWQLEPPLQRQLLARIRQAGTPLGQYVRGRFYYGIKTGLNEAFVIDGATRARLIAADPNSAEVIKPLLRGRDVKRWQVMPQDLWLIFTRRPFPIENYPAIAAHLEQFKTQLMPKPADWEGDWNGRAAGHYEWFEIQTNTAYWEEFAQPKIIVPAITNTVNYAADLNGFYSNDKTSIIVATDWRYLLAVLNSRLSWWWSQRLCASKANGFFEFKPMYISQFPIPAALDQQKLILETLVTAILNAAELRFEQLINALMYELYFADDLHNASIQLFVACENAQITQLAAMDNVAISQFANRIFAATYPIAKLLLEVQQLPVVQLIESS